MNMENRIECRVIAEHALNGYGLQQRTAQGWLLFNPKQRLLKTVDVLFAEQAVISAPELPPDCRAVAQCSLTGMFACACRDRLSILSANGKEQHRIAHPPWPSYGGGGCLFDRIDGLLWAAIPHATTHVTKSYGTVVEHEADDEVCLIAPDSGKVLQRTPVCSEVGFFSFHSHPTSNDILVELGCGQDGLFLFRAQRHGQTFIIDEYQFNNSLYGSRIFGGFDTDGSHFLTLDHYGEDICVHKFPSGEISKSIQAEVLFAGDTLGEAEEPDSLEYHGVYAANGFIICLTRFGRLLALDHATLQPIGTLWWNGLELTPYDMNGKPATAPEEIIEFSTGLESISTSPDGNLLAQTRERAYLIDLNNRPTQ